MAHNLVQPRKRGFAAQLNVPADVQGILGRSKFRKGLGTKDRSQAIILAGPIVAGWRQEILNVRTQTETEARHECWAKEGRPKRRKLVEEPEEDEAVRVRRLQVALREANTDEEKEGINLAIDDWLWDVAAINRDWSKENQKSADIPEVRELVSKIFAKPTLDNVEDWLTWSAVTQKIRPKTIKQRRAAIKRLARTFPHLEDINQEAVRVWTVELLASGLKGGTAHRLASDCRAFYKYLVRTKVVEPSEPFHALELKLERSERLAWAPEDLVTLHGAAAPPLDDLLALAMHSGARLGELAFLLCEDVTLPKSFRVRESKTPAGRRTVPIHPAVLPIFERLVRDSTDGYVVPIHRADRSDDMSRAFTKLRRSLGYNDDRLVFRSIRHSVVSMLRAADVPEATVAEITGHRHPTITFGLYSGPLPLEKKAKALAKLRYPGFK